MKIENKHGIEEELTKLWGRCGWMLMREAYIIHVHRNVNWIPGIVL